MTTGHVYLSRRMSERVMAMAAALPAPLVTHEVRDLPPSRTELLARCRGASALITMLTERIDDEVLEAAGSGLRIVSNVAAGFDNIDVGAAAVIAPTWV